MRKLQSPASGRRRYVAIGDSFTEGVGDPSKHLPHGLRGWADRVADGLAKAEPGWEYANLAIRSKRLRHIIAEQLGPAMAMEPTLVTLYAGGNDIMDLRTDVEDLLRQYELLVARLASTGAKLLVFTGYDVQVSPVLQVLRKRHHLYNEGVRRLAAQYGAVLIDYWSFDAYREQRMWNEDRLHMSKAGHKYMAAKVLDILNVPHGIRLKTWKRPRTRSLRDWEREQRRWMHNWVLPMLGRKIRGTTLGDNLSPRWPEPVLVPPEGGLRALVQTTLDAAAPNKKA